MIGSEFAMNYILVEEAIKKHPELIHLLRREEETVLCVNSENGKKKKLSFRALYDNNHFFWQNPGSTWEFYLQSHRVNSLISRLREQSIGHSTAVPDQVIDDSEQDASTEADDEVRTNFGGRYDQILGMNSRTRLDLLNEHADRLNGLLTREEEDTIQVVSALTDSAQDASLINKTLIDDSLDLENQEAKERSKEMVSRTEELVKSSTSLIDESIFHGELFDSIVNKSNGTVVQHMTRTYVRSVSFLLHYNKKILNSSLPNRIRIEFKKKYKPYYTRLLPNLHSDDVVLERVFYSGMQAISPQQIHRFATGFLLHDVGKAKDIDYHEGNEGYNREKIVDHVKQGYLAIVNKTVYPVEVSLITGYHHEYYGHSSGYGFYRAQLNRFLKEHPKHRMGYVMSYTLKPVLNFETLSFFPAKVLEIVDVFDALTDPNRTYKEPLPADDALQLMRREFVENELKLDPILLDLFIEYRNTQPRR